MKWLYFLGLLLCLWVGVSGVSKKIEGNKPPSWAEKKFNYLPSGKFLRPMLLGHDQAVASILWTQGVLYFADAFLEGKSYEWLGHILLMVSNLDPKFAAVYERGALMLPGNREAQKTSLKILQKGMRELPGNYRIRLYAAMAILDIDSNYRAAAEYLKPLRKDKKAPVYLKNLATTLLSKSGNDREWIDFLLSEYIAEKSSLQREKLTQRMVQLTLKKSRVVEEKVLKSLVNLLESDPKLQNLVKKTLLEIIQGELSEETQKVLQVLQRSTALQD